MNRLKTGILITTISCIVVIISLEFYWALEAFFWSKGEVLMNRFPSDIHFYLNYAKNMAQGRFYSWNGISPSNGFHPLWALVLTPLFWLSSNVITIYKATVFIQVVLFVLLCTTVFIFVYKRKNKNFALLSLLLLTFWTPYLYDGMETALASLLLIVFVGLIFSFLDKENVKRIEYLTLGLVTTAMFLSRLDLVLITGPVILYFSIKKFIIQKKYKLKFKKALFFFFPPCIIMGAYLIINKFYVGHFMPLSGAVKSTFPALGPHISHSLDKSALGVKALILTMILLSGWFIILKLKKKNKNYFPLVFFTLLACGALLHLSYHVLFTYATEIGSWYFVYDIFLFILTIVFLLDFSIKEAIKQSKNLELELNFNNLRKKTILVLSSLGALLIILFISGEIYLTVSDKIKKVQESTIPDARTSIVKEAVSKWKKNEPNNYKIFDGTDGQFAYFSGIPTYHAKGMANTPDFVKVRQKLIETTRDQDHNKAEIILEKYFERKDMTHIVGYKRWNKQDFPSKCLKKHKFIFKKFNKKSGKPQLVYIMTKKQWLKMFDSCNINEFGLVWDNSLKKW
ncbi:MAG: hypothetical protein ABEJ02_04100 [Candidatus Paceibacteria bacterium]